MAYDPLGLGSTANDGTGDKWRAGGTKINAMFSALYTTVATNAAAILVNAQSIIDTTALITGFTKTYWFDANDTATTATPITHTGGATTTYLTNNALGSFTNSYNPDTKDALWNPSTNKFDFTSLKIGDTIEMRSDIEVDTSAANQELDLLISIAEGTASPYELNITHSYYKSISTGNKITFLFRVYIGDEVTRTGGARFRFSSANNATIKVNGWFYQITAV
jgi:hypothetical protein